MRPYCPRCKEPIPDADMRACPACAHSPSREGGLWMGWPRDARIGQRVAGDLQVLKLLGGGGFGRVYEVARLGASAEHYALKVLNDAHQGDPAQEHQFQRELRLLMQLRHPSVVHCHRGGRLEDGALYLLMELIRGHDLLKLVPSPQAALDPRRAAHIGAQIAQGLATAHALGVLHRDLKPENILVSANDHAHIIDFGLGKELGQRSEERKLSRIIGTPLYMAPEQCNPGQPVDDRLDLYQLGAVLHFLLTGHPPYRVSGSTTNPALEMAQLLLQQHRRIGLGGPRPSDLRPDLDALSPDLDALVAQLLSTEPERRPNSAAQLATRLSNIAQKLATGPQKLPQHLPRIAPDDAPTPGYHQDFAAVLKNTEDPRAESPGHHQNLVPMLQKTEPPPKAAPKKAPRRARWVALAALLAVSAAAALGIGALWWWRDARTNRAAASFAWTVDPSSPLRLRPEALGELLPQVGAASTVEQVLYAPNGAWWAASERDGAVRLYDPARAQAVRVLRAGPGGASLLAASADGRRLVTAGQADRALVWAPATGALEVALEGFRDGVDAMAISPDGARLALASGGVVTLWALPQGRQLRALTVTSPGTVALAFVPGQDALVAVSDKAEVQVIPLATLEATRGLQGGGAAWTAALSPDGALLALASREEAQIRLLRLSDGGLERALPGHPGGVLALAFSADGAWLASGGATDRDLRVWSVRDGAQRAAPRAPAPGAWSVALSADGAELIAARPDDRRVHRWRLEQPAQALPLPDNDAPPRHLAVQPDGPRLATASAADARIWLWDSASGRALGHLEGHEGGVSALAWGGDADRLLSASAAEPVAALWNVRHRKRLLELRCARGAVRSLAASGRGRWITLGDQEGSLHHVAAGTGKAHPPISAHDGPVTALAWTVDEELLASGGEDALIHIWRRDHPRLAFTLRGHTGAITSLAWSAGGDQLLSGGLDGVVRLWDAQGEPLQTWDDHGAEVWQVAFSRDGSLIGSVGADGALRLRDPRDRQPGATRRRHNAAPRALAFTAQGARVITAADDLLIEPLAGDDWWRLWQTTRGWLTVWHDGRFDCLDAGCQGYLLRMGDGRLADHEDLALRALRQSDTQEAKETQ